MWTEALPIVVYSTFTHVVVQAPDWALDEEEWRNGDAQG